MNRTVRKVSRRRDALVRNLDSRLPPDAGPLQVLAQAAASLLREVPADVWSAVVLDPSTLLHTGGLYTHGLPHDVMPRLFEIEHVEADDVDSLRNLATRPAAASALSRSTGGDLASSRYFTEILRPLGLADELRVLLREGGRTWGLLVLARAGSAGFGDDDLQVAAAISAPAAGALRRSLLAVGHADSAAPDAPGMIVLDDGHDVASASPTAQHWLGEIQEIPAAPPGRLPYAVAAIATRTRAVPPDTVVRARAATRSRQWVSLYAWRSGGLTTVALAPPQPGELVALILDAYGLTAREHDVTRQVLLGRSTAQIAGALRMSALTVQDHLKSVFDKTGVRSRRDLVADVFFRHCAPRLDHPDPSTGRRLLHTPGR
ncbi:helix-turn-helix transcriptional regulator [Catellatospora sp. TT07R-123]|uniref:helix-turn-helix transcriptional regulator n=1 Tax=Catellatospora sp. TT07R-123 TaxID=2733863 RepID=UPI001B0F5A0D|nr:helix-turn-helix transcriptional regulator [Catellatospora sp. TT07R-123]GHJ42836.1 helix-turn-helix transcriptional regulator [Catellatospora sp. TT07R-123]